MTEFLLNYGLFVVKIATGLFLFVLALLALGGLFRKRGHQEDESELRCHSLNEKYEAQREELFAQILDEKAFKAREKARKKAKKKEKTSDKPHLFVLDFYGDVEASEVETLREQISLIVQVAQKDDRVLLRLESGGGYVSAYGLAAAQLARLREREIFLVIAVDEVAASGGYMMACLANHLIAAPFAILGSVGVIGALPNFHDLLEKNHIHYEQHTAGEHKRSLTVFGENTDADRAQFQHELTTTHDLFKAHVKHYRPQVDIDRIATGETWYGSQCLDNQLIDALSTSDDYILAQLDDYEVLALCSEEKEDFIQRLKREFLGRIAALRPFKTLIQ